MSRFRENIWSIILIIVIATIAILGYYYRNSNLFLVSCILFVGSFFKLVEGKTKLLKVIQIGDFRLKNDIDVDKVLFGKSTKGMSFLYRFIPGTFVSLIVMYINLNNPDTFIITGLSIISVGLALSILTFSHSNSLPAGEDQKIIFSSARRFFLATILGIFVLFFVILYKYVGSPGLETSQMFPSLFLSIENYFRLLLHSFAGLLYYSLLFISINNFIDGLFLSLKGTIDF